MNFLQSRVPLKLRTLPDVLDLSLLFCRRNAWPLAKLSLWTLLPMYLALLALRYFAHFEWSSIWLLALIVGVMLEGVFVLNASELLFADAPSIKKNLRRFFRRSWKLGLTLLLSRVLLLLYSCTLVLLPFGLMRTVCLHEISLLEEATPVKALGRAHRFSKGYGGRALLFSLALLTFRFAAIAGMEVLGQNLVEFVFQLGEPIASLWSTGGSPFALLGFFLAIPYLSVAHFLVYLDIRTRKEGWDIQLRFSAIAAARDEVAA